MNPFLSKEKECDAEYTFIEEEFSTDGFEKIYEAETYSIYKKAGCKARILKSPNSSVAVVKDKESDTSYRIYGTKQAFRNCWELLIPGNLALEEWFLKRHAFFLHASLVRWKGRGILFSAPSGMGKSTQADLWKKYENAEILNGDRALICAAAGDIIGYGSPLAGSSQIYKDESAPLSAIFLLEQGKENLLENISAGKAFAKLYSQILSNPWEEAFLTNLTEELLLILRRIPVYRLQCRPDRGAVEIAKQEIENLHEGIQKRQEEEHERKRTNYAASDQKIFDGKGSEKSNAGKRYF